MFSSAGFACVFLVLGGLYSRGRSWSESTVKVSGRVPSHLVDGLKGRPKNATRKKKSSRPRDCLSSSRAAFTSPSASSARAACFTQKHFADSAAGPSVPKSDGGRPTRSQALKRASGLPCCTSESASGAALCWRGAVRTPRIPTLVMSASHK